MVGLRAASGCRVVVAIVAAALIAGCDAIPRPTPTPPSSLILPSDIPTDAPASASAAPSPTAVGLADFAIAPIVAYRSTATSTGTVEVADILRGVSSRYIAIEVPAMDADAILDRLGAPAAGAAVRTRVVVAPGAAEVIGDLAAHSDRLAFIRADDVVAAVRAIAWEGIELFGTHRVARFADWPLWIQAPSPASGAGLAYDPASAWSLVAGGDVNLDGNVANYVKTKGYGVDYPWNGGTARITSRFCCSTWGLELARVKRTGHKGAIRDLLSSADLAIANFENPAPDDFTYHFGGYTFSADPALIEGLRNAGIDWVSLANNHIGNAGLSGVVETLANLDAWGIAHGGAGADLAEARQPSMLPVGRIRVAILAYDTIRPGYAATAERPGSNQMSVERVTQDVAAARAAGADVVIVFPHWGIEYTSTPSKRQRTLAHAAIDAGADLVLGNHTHWVGAMEIYNGRPIIYSLADFVFSIRRSEQTMEGIMVEATFDAARLVQLRIHPFFIIDGVQPNLLEPKAGADAVLDQLFEASSGLLPW